MKSAEIFKTINWLEEMGIENYTINRDLTVDVDADVDLIDVGLTEIPIQFGVVTGWFDCSENKLTSLEGAPREVEGWFNCENNQLTSLEGAPREVGGMFFCYGNQLTSLKGAPEIVGESFDCSRNQLTSLEGAPREVERSFWCENNKHKFNEEEVKAICKVGMVIYV